MNDKKTIIWQEEATRSRATTYRLGAETFVKCITELITNSQVAYSSLKNSDQQNGKFKIKIVANQRKQYFEVYDFATGLAKNMEELNERIGSYSRMHKDVHTVKSRSMFGRGLSDVLFRQITKEALVLSNKDGVCFKITCKWDKKAGIKDPELQPVFIVDPNAKDEIRDKLPLGGTYVKFNWSNKENINFPTKTELIESLRRYYELKNLLSDPSYDVILEYHGLDGNITSESLKFFTCVKSPIGIELRNIALPIRGYNIKILSAKMYRSEQPLNQQKHSESRTGGLYIEGEHGQIYDLTLFGLEEINPEVTQRLVGEVILSDDAKKYFQDAYTEGKEEVLTRAREGIREGHRFYKILKSALIDWIKETIASESKTTIESMESDLGKESYLELNKIAGEFLDKFIETPDTVTTGSSDSAVETMEFAKSEYSIIQGKVHRISLLFNPQKFSQGTKVEFISPNPDFKISIKKDSIPENKSSDKNISLTVDISCSILESTGSVIAKSTMVGGETTQARAELTCTEESIEPPIHEYLEFKPDKVAAEPDHLGKAHLWMHANMINSGDYIELNYVPSQLSETEGNDESIEFQANVTSLENGKKTFAFTVNDSLPIKNGYREYQVKFIGKKEGIKGVLTATVKGEEDIPPAQCEIEIRSKVRPGLLRGWTAEPSVLPQYAYFKPSDGYVVFNLNSGLVKKILGESKEIARKRRNLYQEVAMYIATGIMDIFLEFILKKAARENPAAIFDAEYLTKHSKGELPWDEAIEAILLNKHKIINKHGKAIVTKFVQDIRDEVPPDDIRSMEITHKGKAKIQFTWHKKHTGPEDKDFEKWITIKGSKNEIFSVETFVFKINNLALNIRAYRLSNGRIAICLYDILERDWREKILRVLLDEMQVYDFPSDIPKGVKGNCLYSPVSLCKMDNGKLTFDHLVTIENIHKIPDSPKKNAYEQVVESGSNWLDNGTPVIHYDLYENIVSMNKEANLIGKLVCLIESERIDIMTLNFFRTKIIPVVAEMEKLS